MPHFRYECFCDLTYDPDLSYEDLLACETELTQNMQACLQENGGAHLDFFQTGDSLLVHCLFVSMEPADFAALCKTIASFCTDKIGGRLTLLDKHGDTLLIGYTANSKSRLTAVRLPAPKDGVGGKKPLCSVVR